MTKAKSAAEKAAAKAAAVEKRLAAIPTPSDVVASKASHQKSSGEKVTVGLKLPNGLELRIYDTIKIPELLQSGTTRDVPRAVQIGESVTLNGFRTRARGNTLPAIVVGGYAMTPGVDKDFMRAWMEQNKSLDLVKNGLIIIQASNEKAQDEATEKKGVRCGLEPIHPEPLKDKRIAKSPNPNLTMIERAEAPAA